MSTTVPAVCAKLVDVATAALSPLRAAVDPIPVMWGPPGGTVPLEYACIAWSDDADTPGVSGARATAAAGNNVATEAYTVRCKVTSAAGDGSMADRVDRVRVMFEAVEAAVRADRTLGGVLTPPGLAEVTAADWTMDLVTGGLAASVAFDVAVQVTLWTG